MTVSGREQRASLPGLSADEAAALARRHRLEQVGVRPPFGRYVGELWQRRQFLLTMAQGDFLAGHQNNYLGLLWSVLNPLLLGLAYLLIFGFLLDTSGDVDNFIAFLTIGLFTFLFVSVALNYASRSIVDKTSLVRALRFPRVVLPLSVVLTQLISTVPAFLILVVIALSTGERPTWEWVLFPVSVGVVGVITAGMGLLTGRLLHEVRDSANLIPLLIRLLRYVSGVFFPVAYFADRAVDKGAPQWVATTLEYQPIAVSLTLVRETLLGELAVRWETWAVSLGWAVLLFGAGFVVFWRAEATYGRT
ncbi:MAG: ABC transporter permease [Actinomycetota bacterium]|nr:ABC transporter permease [Actinomycetota bacterium]